MKRSVPWLLLVALVVLCICLVCLVALVAVFRPEWLPFQLPGISRGQIVVRVPDRRQETDYYLLRPGQELDGGLLLADDARLTTPTLWGQQTAQGFVFRPLGFGAFLPESRALLYSVQTEDGISLNWLSRRGAEPREVHQTDDRITTVLTLDGGETVFLVEEYEPGRVRCYVSHGGEEAQRVARGDSCQVSSDGSTLLVSDATADALTLTASDLDGNDSVVLLDEEEGTDGTFRLSPDGARVAYVSTDGELSKVVAVSRQDGRVLAEGDEFFSVLSYEFAPEGTALFVIGETEDGNLALSLLDDQTQPIATGQMLDASFSPDGQSLVYLVADETGDEALLVHPSDGGDDVAVIDGGDLSFALLEDPDALLVLQTLEGETILHRAEPRGSDIEELFSVDGLQGLEIFDLPDDPRFFALASDNEGRQILYVGPTGETPGFELLEDWAALTPLDLSPDGRWLAFAGQEDPGDDPVLYTIRLVDGENPVELDSDLVGIQGAVFTDSGSDLLYTALTGSEADEVEVRTVRSSGARPYEMLYSEAVLEAASWGAPDPFGSAILALRSGLGTTGLCPGAPTIVAGDEIEDTLEQGGRNCYRFRAEEALDYTVGVTTDDYDLDSRMEVYDRQGTLIGSDDDSGPGLSPRLALTLEEGALYYVYIFGYSDGDTGSYTVTVTEGRPGTLQEEAVLLPFDETVRGAITAESEVFIEEFDTSLFAAAYYFSAQPEDWVVADLSARSIGSSLEPMMVLFDSNLQVLTFAEPGMDDELQLVYSIPAAGRYYLLILSADEGYGSADDYFFEVTLTLGEPPEPGGGPIEIGETVEGNLQPTIHDEWTFSAESGVYVTISMTSDAFDTYLELYDPFGVQIAFDDDSGGNLNSRISDFRLTSEGTYTIRARSYSGRSSGPYTLSLTAGEPDTTSGGTIRPGETVEGDIRRGDQDEWTFEGAAGQVVSITMRSGEIDSYLILLDPYGVELIRNDDGAGYPDAMIEAFELPDTGTYTIIARTFGDSGAGEYTLALDLVAE